MNNLERIAHVADLELAGFPKEAPYAGLRVHLPTAEAAQCAFDRFRERVLTSLHRTYLPVYRMADGEFSFLVGWKRPGRRPPGVGRARYLYWMFREATAAVSSPQGPTCWGESYSRDERAAAVRRIESGVKQIARDGVLALYFLRQPDYWGERYIAPVCAWMDELGVALTDANYVPFYFVYALLNGPDRKALFAGRRVVVVTHLTEERRQGILAGLRQQGVRDVQFVPISGNRAMFDQVDLSRVVTPVDFALVAAGIGSANILSQLESLSCPCIDCGITMECLINPSLRATRPFLACSPPATQGEAEARARLGLGSAV